MSFSRPFHVCGGLPTLATSLVRGRIFSNPAALSALMGSEQSPVPWFIPLEP